MDYGFTHYREGQSECLEQLRAALRLTPMVCLEAPTGYGKTGLALTLALEAWHKGECKRILYLTTKATGQIQVVDELLKRGASALGIRVFALRNQAEHEIPEAPLSEVDANALHLRWKNAYPSFSSILPENYVSLEWCRGQGALFGIPPWIISKAVMPYADVWIADYNYVFSPHNSTVFNDIPGYDPSHTFLIVDEAHHLEERVAQIYSVEINVETAVLAGEFLPENATVRATFDECVAMLDSFKKGKPVSLDVEDDFSRIIAEFDEALPDNRRWMLDLPDWAMDFFSNLKRLGDSLKDHLLERDVSCPESGALRFECLEAPGKIAEELRKFHNVLLMSATLLPEGMLTAAWGLNPRDISRVEAEAAWHYEALDVAVDLRVDTRLKSRERHYTMTAETIALCIHHGTTPIVVFFPSYAYAETIQGYLRVMEPFIRVGLQVKDLPLDAQQGFIEEALLLQDAVFLILGSGFSEGVDMLGGRVVFAIVVSPALPEVNRLQEIRLESKSHLGRELAFEQTYIVPGLRKIRQAIGRLIRQPGHRAKILLHDKRFANGEYLRPLKLQRPPTVIVDEGTLADWLSRQSPDSG